MRGDSAVIIVAGGLGKRFGGKVRKQYLSLLRRPLLWWTLNAFDRSPSVGALTLVVPEDDLQRVKRQFTRWKIRKPLSVVSGGAARADSVRRGLAAVPPSYKWVAVHDGVRPLITPELIENVFIAARAHRAAIAAAPSKDTVKLAGPHQLIERTVPRERVWLAQTPQAFDRRLLERAHKTRQSAEITDDAQLVERLGVRVKLVFSPPENLKVTVPMDLKLAEALLRRRGASPRPSPGGRGRRKKISSLSHRERSPSRPATRRKSGEVAGGRERLP